MGCLEILGMCLVVVMVSSHPFGLSSAHGLLASSLSFRVGQIASNWCLIPVGKRLTVVSCPTLTWQSVQKKRSQRYARTGESMVKERQGSSVNTPPN